MDPASINSPAAAAIAGLVTSLHCAGMCGPLACAVMPGSKDRGDPAAVASAYQLARLASYVLLGAVAGGVGRLPLGLLPGALVRWVPWIAVLCFLGLAFRWDRRWPRFAGAGRRVFGILGRFAGRSRIGAASALGFATPLLPCGPLYLVVTLALLSGSALRGATLMLAFGLGTLPLLWVAQTRFGSLQRRLTPAWAARLRVVLALSAAIVAGWRLRGTVGLGGPAPSSFLCP